VTQYVELELCCKQTASLTELKLATTVRATVCEFRRERLRALRKVSRLSRFHPEHLLPNSRQADCRSSDRMRSPHR
jgi:hypothetical protein